MILPLSLAPLCVGLPLIILSLALLPPSIWEGVHFSPKEGFDCLSAAYSLYSTVFYVMIGVDMRQFQNFLHYVPWEAFDKRLYTWGTGQFVFCFSADEFKVRYVLVNLWPLHFVGVKFAPGFFCLLCILEAEMELVKKLVPSVWDVINWVEAVKPFAHHSCPIGDLGALDKGDC